MNPYASPTYVASPQITDSCKKNHCSAFVVWGVVVGVVSGWIACEEWHSYWYYYEVKWSAPAWSRNDYDERKLRQTEVGAPLDHLRERIDKRREDRPQPKPVEPVKPHEIEDKPAKPRPFLHWLGRMGKNTADLFALPTKMELHAVLIALLTLLTVVVGMTFGFLKARYYYLAKVQKAKR